ncbi:hypothetical protein LAZ67_12001829 [Cordylochernes scorpioides]|uniref:Reverse transcriptase domain-containing protein n=1 Tax=Cordylochernes scorpioides TaxID=51811 RepID=A0ABY6L1C3_9ARAC|nr:hypothetical protein LAZ67_12001829 [Cordylochernes scorpioides]
MSPGTRASKLVDSYPLTAENYPKVIETLTERFGRPELLQQIYVRDLIRLMIDCSSKQQLKVTSFYDELVTHLRALESLNIEARQMSVFIFPMLEACLSEELMKAWQRSPLHDVKIDANESTQTRVDLIMEFLQKEAAAEQDRALAGSKFGLKSLTQDRNMGRQSHPTKIPTASRLCWTCPELHLLTSRLEYSRSSHAKSVETTVSDRLPKVAPLYPRLYGMAKTNPPSCIKFNLYLFASSCEEETRFGWTLMGECQPGSDVSLAHHVTTMTISDSSITNLWNLDVLGIMDPIEVKQRDQRDALARRHFLKPVQHSVSGRYVVSLPWTVEKAKIADSREDYDDIFRGWLDDGIIEKVPAEQHDAEAFYLPHRPVVKLSSGTTPIRPAFNASSKVYRSPSLNDCLEKGLILIEMIPNLMLRFINVKFGIVADIKKAFLQIEVNERDRDYLRFLWYSQNGENTEVFRHRRVVFGVNCSPFILGAVIEYHLSNARPEHEPLAQRLQKSFYVDNLVISVNSFEELQDLKLTATSIMENARMEAVRSIAWTWPPILTTLKEQRYLKCLLHKGMAIPRNFNPLMVPQKDWQIHTFVDASNEAYAAVAFLRTRVGDKIEVHIMAAKSRVAPLKRPTIPRLEPVL